MKHLKMLGLLVVAAASLMAFAGSAYASNPVLTSTGAAVAPGSTLDASATESLFLEASVIQITCTESTVHGTISVNTNGVASGPIGTLSFDKCGESTVDVLANGSLEMKSGGEVRTSGNRVTTEAFGISCVYGGGTGTKVGTLKAGGGMKIEANLPKQTGSNFLCPGTAVWSGNYQITTPHSITVD